MERTIKIVTIVGARPQFIKAAAFSRALVEYNAGSGPVNLLEVIVHTGQHYDRNMSEVFFEELNIPRPNYNLGVGSGRHGQQTGEMLSKIEQVLIDEKPDWCLVYGDTNSTLAGALAATKLHIPIAHVEAGLRSYNRQMPEEINRILTDDVSDLLFCPTQTAVDNLKKEGISKGVKQVGDVMYDCSLFYINKTKGIKDSTLGSVGLEPKSYYLATVHRAENTDDANHLRNIISSFNEISSLEVPVCFPAHPRTQKMIRKFDLKLSENVLVISPVSYMKMVVLESNAKLILTDSGGVQKEAFFYHVPCVTLRNETEWVETVKSGLNCLVGSDTEMIKSAIDKMTSCDIKTEDVDNYFGDGCSAQKIVNCFVNF